MNMADLKLGCLIVNGINNRIKRNMIFKELFKRKLDLCLLQEVYSTSELKPLWSSEWGGKIIFSHFVSNSRGVTILVSSRIMDMVKIMSKDSDGQFLCVLVEQDDRIVLISNIYAPNYDKPEFFE